MRNRMAIRYNESPFLTVYFNLRVVFPDAAVGTREAGAFVQTTSLRPTGNVSRGAMPFQDASCRVVTL